MIFDRPAVYSPDAVLQSILYEADKLEGISMFECRSCSCPIECRRALVVHPGSEWADRMEDRDDDRGTWSPTTLKPPGNVDPTNGSFFPCTTKHIHKSHKKGINHNYLKLLLIGAVLKEGSSKNLHKCTFLSNSVGNITRGILHIELQTFKK